MLVTHPDLDANGFISLGGIQPSTIGKAPQSLYGHIDRTRNMGMSNIPHSSSEKFTNNDDATSSLNVEKRKVSHCALTYSKPGLACAFLHYGLNSTSTLFGKTHGAWYPSGSCRVGLPVGKECEIMFPPIAVISLRLSKLFASQ